MKIETLDGLHRKIVEATPALRRGVVHCPKCKSRQMVDSEKCLRSGWPVCCGETMFLGEASE